MEAALREINSVTGVKGSFVCASHGEVVVQAMPAPYDGASLEGIARLLSQTFNALETSRQPVKEVDLVFEQERLIARNLSDGILVILCARNINLPLLNITSKRAVESLSAKLATASAPKLEVNAGNVSVGAPVQRTDSSDHGGATELYIDLEKESQRLINAAASAQVKLCVMDPIALRARLSTARARAAPPIKRQIDFLARSDQTNLLIRVLERLGYQPNQRFNAFYGTRFLNFNEPTRLIGLNVFLDAYDMNHRIDLTGVLAQNETILTETGLALVRLQFVEITETTLNELCALFLEHDLSAGVERGKIDATQITRVCAEDWGLYRTITMNLERLRALVARELSPSEEASVVNRIQRLRQGIDSAPKSLRWQTRARIGDTVRWYETPQIGGAAARPDLALG